MFERLRKEHPSFTDKVSVIKGDILLPNFGLSTEDEETLIKNISVVFHSAATVKFDEALK